ncbi:cytochrome P450 4V2, partial [Trichonephila clavata]
FCFWIRKISEVVPGRKYRLLNLLGSISDLNLFQKSRNAYSILVCGQQILAGYAKLFVYSKIYSVWIFFYPLIILAKAEAVEAIFSGNKTTERPPFYKMFFTVFGTGLFTSNGALWKSRRKMTNPCFRYDILKEYVPSLNEHAQVLVKRLKEETDKDFTRISRLLSHYAFDVAFEFVMGAHMRAQESRTEPEFLYATKRIFSLMSRRTTNILLWPDFIFNRAKSGKEVKKHIATVKAQARSVRFLFFSVTIFSRCA